ncbi:unnamed protein product, partial [marine sediment metagenome]
RLISFDNIIEFFRVFPLYRKSVVLLNLNAYFACLLQK